MSKTGHVLPFTATVTAAAGIVLFAPSAVEASFGQQTLRQGMDHPDVVELQTMLKDKGYFTYHTATGYFGTITEEAVRKFQREANIQVDGVVGPETYRQLLSTSAPAAPAPSQSVSDSGSASDSSFSSTRVVNRVDSSRLLREGVRGQDVEALQLALKQKGFLNIERATGYFGTVTAKGVRDFQQARGLKVDGIAGPQTIGRLNAELNATGGSGNSTETKEPSPPASSSTDTLREGMSGDSVRALQTRLKDLGHYHHRVTGIFGPLTKSAVISFQRNEGLTADGIAGARTLKAMQQASAAPAPTGFLLKEGDTGSNVRELQERLKATGHYKHNVTGTFGPITKEAVRSFQSQWSLVNDGIVTASVWEKVEEVSSVYMGNAPGGQSSAGSFEVLNVIADAANFIGVPYLWGGTTPAGFDCSGFIQYVFNQNGVQLPRTVAQQWNSMTAVSQPRPGDVVFFETYKSGPSHNGIYIGNNQFIHAGSSTGIIVADLTSGYWSQRYLGAKRVR
ncbi:C40 family peptidase [Salisediminibacterium selenitireducens]|uniref:NLP/P60 protein n=1 Tax=Bacillus selenitireducens (strain ATCC 700615 / DSM 15326 / MLS10) TaxID=439292 RepID=D6Y0J5_BACIE|nr:peptidoglycan-binding protein [Salisediminibacterium selenitireducens]ADI00563.1 NLP/P60 protein [[Bacillus] selenitireducens MLS10]